MPLNQQLVDVLWLMEKHPSHQYSQGDLIAEFPYYRISEIMNHLESNGYISSGFSNHRTAMVYRITSAGRSALEESFHAAEQRKSLAQLSDATETISRNLAEEINARTAGDRISTRIAIGSAIIAGLALAWDVVQVFI